MEVVSIQRIDAAQAEKMIEDYLAAHPGPNFAGEVADALGLEYRVTFKAVHKLLDEQRFKEAKK
jgi:hypothetical protein